MNNRLDNKSMQMEKDMTAEQKMEAIYNNIPGAVFRCRFDEDWTVLEANDGLFELLGYTREEFTAIGNRMSAVIYQPDLEVMAEKIQSQLDEGRTTVENENRLICKNGELKWIAIKAQLFSDAQGEQYFYCVFIDITLQKQTEAELIVEKEKNEIAIENSSLIVWEYNLSEHKSYYDEKCINLLGMPHVTENVPWALIEGGVIAEDSVSDYIELYKQIAKGQETKTKDIQIKNRNGKYVWYRMALKLVTDIRGQSDHAIGWAIDVTAEKEMQQHFQEELKNQEEAQGENLLIKVRANLTKNRIERYVAKDEYASSYIGATYDEATAAESMAAYTVEQRNRLFTMSDREKVLKAFDEGKTLLSMQYQRKGRGGKAIWVSMMVKTYRETYSGDIMSFIYVYDVNQQHTMGQILDKIAQLEYEYMGIIDSTDGVFFPVRRSFPQEVRTQDIGDDYEDGVNRFIEKHIVSEEREEARQFFKLETICRQLEEVKVYRFTFSIMYNGKCYRKKWEYAYMDESRTTILFIRSDITEEYKEQERQKENLRNALAQAEVASHAKSDFLSRMSHEIRTPMNAIIGMNALAAQNVNDPKQVTEYLSNVGISARFLLSLINDILDMSRIESGKMVVKEEKFPFDELINGVNSIIYEQAAGKGIDYDCILTSFTCPYYIGDAMKIQQVLINLLGNAVKFTSPGGKVQLVVHQIESVDRKAHMTFVVNDTGKGMTEEFQRKMFDPFEQENNSTVSPYGGTGLGLAISKNLVTLMGGKISVNSIEGIGSEFTVEIPLGVSEEMNVQNSIRKQMNLTKLHTLVVDDDVVICENTKKVLQDMGMKAEWVDSGRKAVELVKEKWTQNKHFDVILVDWKMPDMDGIETARQIRKIVGPEVTIIIMTAYDWVTIESEAKAAGVNLLISKPLFRSSVMSAFEKIYTHREEQEKQEKNIEYDFTGKKILLVEDHILNVEVAKRLLEAKNAVVEIAENGLASIETFTAKPENYYDIILMDIRMPIMDGLTAARSIRHLKKAYASSVPIVAMSANAFDEDMDKSRAAGMNAHLAKPIEPNLLYATINSFFEKE